MEQPKDSTTEMSRNQLRELLRQQDEVLSRMDREINIYVGILAPLLHRAGGSTVITTVDAMSVADGAIIRTEMLEDSSSLRVWLEYPEGFVA